MVLGASYCGAPPLPGGLAGRLNLDPALIISLTLIIALHIGTIRGQSRAFALSGWAIAGLALVSPLCALSVSLFSARIAQHMILVLIAAPMIGAALPHWRALERPAMLWAGASGFFVALWGWHMPAPYEATFASKPLYWAMHLSLFGSAILLWSTLLRQHAPRALAAGTLTSIQMGLLGAIICLAGYPMYRPHLSTTASWGLTPIADQQLGGVMMWVPGCLLFLWVAVRTLAAIWRTTDRAPA